MSDHALLRFLQRAGGLDVEALRAQIAGSLERATTKAAEIGSAEFEVRADGLRYIIRLNTVVTIVTDKEPVSGTRATISEAE